MKAGLVSITFRQFSPEAVISLASEAGLRGIEWGGDVHVPHGDVKCAQEVAARTRDAGLEVVSYGSYYRCDTDDFSPILDTALALGAPIVRVWAGAKGSRDMDADERQSVEANARQAAQLCAAHGVQIAYEFHGRTLTDTEESAQALLRQTAPARCYWQPHVDQSEAEQQRSLERMLPDVVALHVFSWETYTSDRLPLAAGRDKWLPMLSLARKLPWALIEFVQGDAPEQLLRDAQELDAWLRAIV